MAAWRAHASPCRQPRLGFCTGCGDTALVTLVTLPTAGLLCLGPTDSKMLTAKKANGRWMARVTQDVQKAKIHSKAGGTLPPGPGSTVVLRLVSACSVCMASLGMKQFQL